MCGIVGIVHPGKDDLETLVVTLRDTLAHRGPDDAGVQVWLDHGVGLAQRRLSIIDLSPLGHNPMANADGNVWITYNGEVYNFQEIRKELETLGYTFRSNTDTEVVLHAYEAWGDEHVHRLRGMFAYAIYDRRPQTTGEPYRLTLVRDRAGIKPLYYYWDGRIFLFASEIKAILNHPSVDKSHNRGALFDYLTYLYIPAPKTAYKHIHKLPPASLLRFNSDELHINSYWDIDLHASTPVNSEHNAIELTREKLDEAVRLHMVSDVPVGLFLSGGLDSSTVAAYMCRSMNQPARTFSIGFDVAAYSETHYAKIVSDRFHTDHHERTVSNDSMQSLLPRIVDLYDEPFADASAIPTLQVSQFASEEVKVVLAGDGGDEVFAGYRWYDRWLLQQKMEHLIPSFLRRTVISGLGRAWPKRSKGKSYKHLLEGMAFDSLTQYARQLELFSPAEKRSILGADWVNEFSGYDDYWYFRKYWRPEVDPITRVQYLDFKTYLPDDILTKVDRATMAYGVEARPPLLDHVLVEQIFRIPTTFRFHNNEKKYLLKQAMTGTLPAEILTRGKKGFSSPLGHWMSDSRDWMQQFFHQSPTLVTPAALEHTGYRLQAAKYWALMILESWARKN